MDLRKASDDDIAAELARRNKKFILILANTKRVNDRGAEMHCGNVSLKQARALLDDCNGVLNGKDEVDDNVNLVKRVVINGKVVREERCKSLKEVEEDEQTPNEIGAYDPWAKIENADSPDSPTQQKIEDKAEKTVDNNNDEESEGYDPWLEEEK